MDKFINENRDKFDSSLPDNGHFERFKEKLNAQNKRNKWQILKTNYSIAAVVSFFLISAVLLSLIFNYSNTQKVYEQGSTVYLTSEFIETQNYYINEIEESIKTFEQLNCKNADIDKQEIIMELQAFDNTELELQNELKLNANNQIILNAMISNMQEKAEFLDKVINSVRKNC